MEEMHEITRFFIKKDGKIQCQLCPHNCVIPKDKTGLCGTRINIDGKFYSIVYGRPCAIHIDPIEKKPLYHFYPGENILSVGTLGCNLFCKGCQNYDISRAKAQQMIDESEYKSPKDIVDIALTKKSKMIAYTYNEPTIFYEYLLDIAKLAHKKGIKNVIVSNGFINTKPLKALLPHIDAANIDLKGFNEEYYKQYCHANLADVLLTIDTIIKHNKAHKHKTWIELTNLIIPGLNDDMQEIEKMCKWIAKLDKSIPLHFSRFFPHYKASDIEITPESTLLKAREIALKTGLKYVYVGNLGMLEDTYCECGTLLVDRNKYKPISTGISEDRCIKCNKQIPGIY